MKHHVIHSCVVRTGLLLFFILLLCGEAAVFGAVKTSQLENAVWNTVAESSIIDENGWLQSMCATDQYIVCLINGGKNTTEADTLVAFYRNSTDASGNPVQPYSYAFHVTETDYEHGNGMTFNPNTREIAIAGLFTNDPSNTGAVFIIDADTLRFKRKVQVGDGSWNYFGIDYLPDRNQYVLMANRVADYSFVFTDADFQVTEVMNLGLSSSRSSFQDFCVAGDSIISIPYMQRDGFMNVIDIYSIAQKQRIGSYYLTLPDDSFSVEPEGICQLEPGHLLLASAVIGTSNMRFYETYLPIVYGISTYAENGTVSESVPELAQGESYTVTYGCADGFRLQRLVVDGEELSVSDYPDSYSFTDIHADHSVEVYYEEIPSYTVTAHALHGAVDAPVSAREHESVTVRFAPEAHYELSSLTVDGVPVEIQGNEESYTFEDLTSDHTVEVTYTAIPVYTLTVQAEHGTLKESTVTRYRGESYTTTASPEDGYSLIKCLIDGKRSFQKGKDGNITLDNIQSDHTVTLVYGRIWLRNLIAASVLLVLLTLQTLYLRIQRQRKRSRRARELRRLRREARSFFQDLEDLEEAQAHPEGNLLSLEELNALLSELKESGPATPSDTPHSMDPDGD